MKGTTRGNALASFAFRNTLKNVFNLGMFKVPTSEFFMYGKYGTAWVEWIKAAGRTATGKENALFGIKGSWNYLGGYLFGAGVYGLNGIFEEDCP